MPLEPVSESVGTGSSQMDNQGRPKLTDGESKKKPRTFAEVVVDIGQQKSPIQAGMYSARRAVAEFFQQGFSLNALSLGAEQGLNEYKEKVKPKDATPGSAVDVTVSAIAKDASVGGKLDVHG